jgi:hypothetical protein
MNSPLDPFKEDTVAVTAAIDAWLARLREFIDDRTAASEQDMRHLVGDLTKRLQEGRATADATRAELTRAAERENSQPASKVAEWTRARDTARLHARADRLERSATAAMCLAATSIEEAVRASLIALLARREAIAVQVRAIENP